MLVLEILCPDIVIQPIDSETGFHFSWPLVVNHRVVISAADFPSDFKYRGKTLQISTLALFPSLCPDLLCSHGENPWLLRGGSEAQHHGNCVYWLKLINICLLNICRFHCNDLYLSQDVQGYRVSLLWSWIVLHLCIGQTFTHNASC